MLNVADIVIEILFFDMKMKGLAFHADSILSKESMNSPKYKEKKFIKRWKYAEHNIFAYVLMYIKLMKVMIMIKYTKFINL